MTSDRLTKSYLEKARIRIKALHFLHREKGYSDVVREAQECVELLLKALLRHLGLEIPKVHDVSHHLIANKISLPKVIKDHLKEIVTISRALRKDRELAFYGTEDWIPTEEYGSEESRDAIAKAERIAALINRALK